MKKEYNAPKKLLIVVNALSMGGAENMIYELVKSINRDKFRPEILCYGSCQNNYLEKKIFEICKVRYISLRGRITLNAMKKVFSVMTEINPDIVHAHQGGVTFAVPWCAFHRIPLCITVHSKPEKAFSRANNYMIKVFKSLMNIMVVAVSKENLELVQKFYKLNEKNSSFINNGIDIERFYKSNHDNYTFINVARQDDNKNQIAIIRAFHKVVKSSKGARLILVGDGPCTDRLKKEVCALGIMDSVVFAGQVANPEAFYAQSDVYVQASFREALPLSVLEAMATGLPIIATNVGGLKDVVNKNGILIDAGDDYALYFAMIKIMELPKSEHELLGNESKKIVKSFSSVRMAEQYEQAYDKLLCKRR